MRPMNQAMTEKVLERETLAYRGSGGISAENRAHGFHPAFLDTETGVVYASRYADGRHAPFHLLDGLPNELVLERDPTGRVAAVKAAVTSGFLRDGRFYTRDEAAKQARAAPAHWSSGRRIQHSSRDAAE